VKIVRRFVLFTGLASGWATAAFAADLALPPGSSPPPVVYPLSVPQWEAEIGGRYFFSSGQSRLQLYGAVPSNLQMSRLTYSGLTANAGEIYGRVEHLSGFFLKGYLGGASLGHGSLQDEDFPPTISPYSSTNSDQHGGLLKYGTIDFGWDWRSERFRLGVFAGYLYYNERLNAYGCTQTATNGAICTPAVPSSVLALTSDATWNAARFGVTSEWRFAPGFALTTEIAWLPIGILSASDFHWLRPDLVNPTPENGAAFDQFQLEAILSYQFSPNFSVGAGARHWQIGTTSAEADFSASGGTAQSINYRTERWGGFLQASYRFGDLGPTWH
jgi:hypothetical protein